MSHYFPSLQLKIMERNVFHIEKLSREVCVCVQQRVRGKQIFKLAGFSPNRMCSLIKFAEEPSVPQSLGDLVKVYKGRQIVQ